GGQRYAVGDVEGESLVGHATTLTPKCADMQILGAHAQRRASVFSQRENPREGWSRCPMPVRPLMRLLRLVFACPRFRFCFVTIQAIAWTPSAGVRIIDQRALPDAEIMRDLESAEAVANAIRTLQVRGAPLIGIAAAMGLERSEEHTSELQSR